MAHSVAVTLLRHGMTEANEKKQYLGWSDSPLLEKEIVRLQKGSNYFPGYEILYSSDLPRCLTTASILFPNQNVWPNSSFREMNFGDWEGKTYKQLSADRLYQQWLEHPFEIQPPSGESFPVFAKRVQTGWNSLVKDLLKKNIHRAALMTHGGVIRQLLVNYAPEQKLFWEWPIPNGCGFELSWDNREMFKEGRPCTSLRAVLIPGNESG
jgi:alpha-ribazole phosphatase